MCIPTTRCSPGIINCSSAIIHLSSAENLEYDVFRVYINCDSTQVSKNYFRVSKDISQISIDAREGKDVILKCFDFLKLKQVMKLSLLFLVYIIPCKESVRSYNQPIGTQNTSDENIDWSTGRRPRY